jgi:hypothetical protein
MLPGATKDILLPFRCGIDQSNQQLYFERSLKQKWEKITAVPTDLQESSMQGNKQNHS